MINHTNITHTSDPESRPAPTGDAAPVDPQSQLSRDIAKATTRALGTVASVGLKFSEVRERGGPDPKALNVGARPKVSRLQRAILELAGDEIRKAPGLDPADAVRLARKRLEAGLTAHVCRTEEAYAETEPSRLAARRDGEHDDVMASAMLDACPNLRYALEDLSSPDGEAPTSGPSAQRARPIAAVFLIALTMARPNFEDAYLLFSKLPLLRHIFGAPAGPSNSVALRHVHNVLERKDSDYLQHTIVNQFRRICEARDEHGELRFPKAGRVVLVDGTLMEANIEQRRPRDKADAERMRGPRFRGTGFITYTSTTSAKQDPGVTLKRVASGVLKACHGWKIIGLICQDTGAVMIAEKFPADFPERQAALELIDAFFELWPDCDRFECLVGDSLYDHSKEFAAVLWFGWSIHPVFPSHGTYAKDSAHVEGNEKEPGVLGVPCCPLHRTHDDGRPRLMKFKDNSNVIGIKQRAERGIPRGEMVSDLEARNRWQCSVPGCRETATTWFKRDPRIYTHLHRAGDHSRANLRRALLARRNRIEAFFSSIKNSGLGATGSHRARWAGDAEMRWLILLAAAGHNARILAQLTGAYDRALAEAQSLGHIESDADTTPEAQAQARHERLSNREPAAPPETWTRPNLDRIHDRISELMLAA